jgi:hypothetical protein
MLSLDDKREIMCTKESYGFEICVSYSFGKETKEE